MEKSNYFVKRTDLQLHPIPYKKWVYFVMKDDFKKLGTLTDDLLFMICVGKTRVKVSEIQYWLEEL